MASRQPFSTTDYYNDPRRRAKSALVRAAGRPLRRLGFDLELAHYYSPIPRAEDRPAAWWDEPAELPGVTLDLPEQLAFIGSALADHIDEFRPPRHAGPQGGYHLANGLFQGGDADILYALIRWARSRTVLEIGAGFSTLVASQAVVANRADGHETRLVSYDPYALAPAAGAVPGLAELRPVAAQDIPAEDFEQLSSGDVLFIDSSHTVKIGGDVAHLIGSVLPRLAPGVLVHFHDIYLPWHYPRAWVAHNRWYWAEQYMVQAAIAENPHWEVLIAGYALGRQHPQELRRLVPNLDLDHLPVSLWLRRTGGAA